MQSRLDEFAGRESEVTDYRSAKDTADFIAILELKAEGKILAVGPASAGSRRGG